MLNIWFLAPLGWIALMVMVGWLLLRWRSNPNVRFATRFESATVVASFGLSMAVAGLTASASVIASEDTVNRLTVVSIYAISISCLVGASVSAVAWWRAQKAPLKQ